MTAIAGPGDDQGHKRLPNDLYSKIMDKKASSDKQEREGGERAEKLICQKFTKYCDGDKLANKNVGDDLNSDTHEEAKDVVKKLIAMKVLFD
jgi:hypothetical protein